MVSVGVGFGGCGLALVIWGLGVMSEVVWLRTWADGEGFHALHWNMFRWLGFCTRVLRDFLFGWVERVVAGGFVLWLGRLDVERGIGESCVGLVLETSCVCL